MNSSDNTSPSVHDLEKAVAATSITNAPVEPMDCDNTVVPSINNSESSNQDAINNTTKDLENARKLLQESEAKIHAIMADTCSLNNEKSMNMATAKVSMLNAYISSLNTEIFESTKLQEVPHQTSTSTSVKAGEDDCVEAYKVKETDLPIFKVAESRQDSDYSKLNKQSSCLIPNDESSLKFFIDSFERAFSVKMIDVNKHWFVHLGYCLAQHEAASFWFKINIEKPMENNVKLAWSQVKNLMEVRFKPKAKLANASDNLLDNSQSATDSILTHLDKFRFLLDSAEVQFDNVMKDNLLNRVFLRGFYGKSFKSKLFKFLNNYVNSKQGNNRQLVVSKYSSVDCCDQVLRLPLKEIFTVILNNVEEIQNLFDECNNKFQSSEKGKKRRQEEQKVANNKKVFKKYDGSKNSSSSTAAASTSSTSPEQSITERLMNLTDMSRSLSYDDKQFLRNQGYCSSCRNTKFSFDHVQKCDARKKYYLDKKKVNIETKSDLINNNVKKDRVSNQNISSRAINVITPSKTLVSEANSDSDSSDDDEYTRALAKYDQELINDFELENNNKTVLSIKVNSNNVKRVLSSSTTRSKRKNTVGETNNPFDTDNVAYAPVSCITVNGIDCHCIIDSAAEVSIISKDFALEHKIPFSKTEGFLTVADGTNIPRQQCDNLLNVEYDGLNKTILHKFDVLDNEKLFKEKKIIVGIDLMPKLNIFLTNVAYKFKSTSKVDDAIEDKPYEPNVTPFGTEKEQSAFFNALEPYIAANKKLDPNTLCNLDDSILYLPTPDGYYANVKQYPIAYANQPKVMDIINEWLDSGIITKAEPSEWNLPITVVPKKDLDGNKTDKIRVVLDTRLLNKALPTINETLPLITDIYHAMSGSKVFSTIDLKSAFSQFPVNEPDRKKTSFTAPNGLKYMHVGSPFGISTISQLFSRVMLTLFRDMPFVRCFVDDICIFSQSMQAHFLHVKQVLEILTKVNLKVNFEKSHFAKAEVFLLGFSISEHGRRIDRRKLTNIQNWPRPKTSKQCAAFLGFVNYFRQHLPNVARLMANMDSLRSFDALAKNSKVSFNWTETHEKDFNALKEILGSDIVLSHPNPNHPYSIATDASNFAIGCCLYQEYKESTADGKDKTIIKYIGFFSRKLSKSEQNYSTTMRELLAIIYALKQFHKFIWNVHFTLYCDHRAISYAHSQKNANSMLIKWLDVFLDYDFNVVYIKGLDNVLPDVLSRLFEPNNTVCENKSRNKRILSPRQNHAISNTINNKKKLLSIQAPSEYEIKDGLVVKSIAKCIHENGNYCESDENEMPNKKLFYIQSAQTIYADYTIPPESERKSLLDKAHNQVGHYGGEQMVKRLHLEGIHWPNLIHDCIEFIRKCTECQKHNIEKRGYHPARSLYSYLPGDHYAIDLGGPIDTIVNSPYKYFLVLICVCTRFCVLRPLKDKQGDTVLEELVKIFSLMGPPLALSSDNGKEFSNSLSADLAKALGYDHRFITPLHASANGISERLVQSVKRGLAKATKGQGGDWSLYLNSVQLSLNNRISKRLNTAPFSLMFGRKLIEPYGFKQDNYNTITKPEDRQPMSHEELMKRIDYMTDIVFPAINKRTTAQVELDEAKFNSSHRLVEYKSGDHVMARIHNKTGQLSQNYNGPFTVVRKNQGNAYILRDHTGVLMPRNYTSAELKKVIKEDVIELDDEGNEIKHFEVEAVLNHRGDHRNLEYLLRWKNYSPEWDEWVSASDINAAELVRAYWKKIGLPAPAKRGRPKITNSPSPSSILKQNPPGSMSQFINSEHSDEEQSPSKSPPLHKKRRSTNRKAALNNKRPRRSARFVDAIKS